MPQYVRKNCCKWDSISYSTQNNSRQAFGVEIASDLERRLGVDHSTATAHIWTSILTLTAIALFWWISVDPFKDWQPWMQSRSFEPAICWYFMTPIKLIVQCNLYLFKLLFLIDFLNYCSKLLLLQFSAYFDCITITCRKILQKKRWIYHSRGKQILESRLPSGRPKTQHCSPRNQM